MWVEAYLALDFFGSFLCQDKKNVMLISNSFANRRKKRASSMVVGLRIRQLADALLETQLNFVRTCPCQAKDKIRLLIQKLGGKSVRPPVTAMIDKLKSPMIQN